MFFKEALVADNFLYENVESCLEPNAVNKIWYRTKPNGQTHNLAVDCSRNCNLDSRRRDHQTQAQQEKQRT